MEVNALTTSVNPIYLELIIKIVQIVALIIVGLIVASIAKSLVTKLLEVEKVKNFFNKLDGDETDENMSFVKILAKLVYWLVILIFIIPILSILGLTMFSNLISVILSNFIDFIPALIYAVIIIFIGFFISSLVEKIIYVSLYKVKLNELVQKLTFKESKKDTINISKIISIITYVLLLILFITQALEILNLTILTNVSVFVISLIPSVLASLIILIGAFILGDFLSGIISNSLKGQKFVKIFSNVVKYFVWVIGIGMILNQIGLDIMLINVTYIVLLISLGTALAISFGVGGIETAKKFIEKNIK